MIKKPVTPSVGRTPSPFVSFSPLPRLLACSIALASGVATANDDPFGGSDSLWDIPLDELGQVRVTSLATGTETPLDKAAAVATVITEDDIIAMGATDIDQVLETVPGLHVNRSNQTYTPKYTFRGITSLLNPQALMLVNGIPVTSAAFGNRGNVWGGMQIKTISRIEVIRGPGSALYGADAFAGVINIVTKDRNNINGTQAGLRAGSFNTQAGWVQTGFTTDRNLDIGFVLEYQTTDGQHEQVDQDIQSNLDSAFGTNASLAPGGVNTGVKSTDMRLDIKKDDLRFRVGYQGRFNVETGPGVSESLDPVGQFASNRINTDISYLFKDVAPGFDVESRASYFYNTQEVEKGSVLFPAGTAWPDLSASPPGSTLATFNNGIIGEPEYKEEQARFDLSSVYRGIDNHHLRIGTGFFWGDLYETKESKNFDVAFTPAGPLLQPKASGLTDVSDTSEVFLPEKDRTSYYLFIQDEWQVADNWQLVTGVRYDDYSDFGDTVNPRAALIWATTDSITTKLLYGRAFRAPSIAELFATANPVALGNSDLEPETIDTYELALSQQVNREWLYSVNLFYYSIDDYIDFVPSTGGNIAQNIGERTGKGGEFELQYDPTSELRIIANYAYQRATDDNTDKLVGEAPNNQVYGRTEWSFMPQWQSSLQINWVGEQKRAASDTRNTPVDDYITVDVTLRKQNVVDKLDATLMVKNIFDESVVEPSAVGGIPSDYPMAGISLYGEIAYNF
ncbi:TonB-dependent receptor plug domain-containing protein [Alkalimarinus coralli]|uniref:TonB-dependent receptor plug domain-containing protein n=1 Tax=Alkalimarinus coralli TaxID=2935863 RepID=UPI002112DF9D|nr:TonB-dependent receptor [Alkalimarinus coralli]